MTNLEREYFNTFTLERLKAFYKAIAKETNFATECDWYSGTIEYNGASYVTRVWMRPGGKKIELKINKRKIRQAIKEREESLNNTK